MNCKQCFSPESITGSWSKKGIKPQTNICQTILWFVFFKVFLAQVEPHFSYILLDDLIEGTDRL